MDEHWIRLKWNEKRTSQKKMNTHYEDENRSIDTEPSPIRKLNTESIYGWNAMHNEIPKNIERKQKKIVTKKCRVRQFNDWNGFFLNLGYIRFQFYSNESQWNSDFSVVLFKYVRKKPYNEWKLQSASKRTKYSNELIEFIFIQTSPLWLISSLTMLL